MEHLKVKNWEKYQHYKNRNPPWIKLHVSTLNDRDFISLSLASKGLLMQLWILASENEGKIPYDLGEIKFRLRDNTIQIDDINLLINKKFLKICKQMLADESKCLSETEAETEAETELVLLHNTCPQQKIVDLWREILPELPQPKSWDGVRQQNLRTRWKEDEKRQDIEWWRKFFTYIRTSSFLMGHVDPAPGRTQFYAKLDWVVKKANFEKIREGNYHRGIN
jgi:hypothetical protein